MQKPSKTKNRQGDEVMFAMQTHNRVVELEAALKEIATMKPSELAPKTMPGLVHGPALLLSNCQRIARRALRAKPTNFVHPIS